MRKILFLLITMASFTTLHAQSVGEMFVSIPDSLFPYMVPQQRTEILKLKSIDPTEPAIGHTIFQTEVKLSLLSENILKMELSPSITMELGRLSTDTDSVFCLIKTVSAPEKISVGYIYNKEWKKIEELNLAAYTLTAKPDTMSLERYEELIKMIEFPMVEAHFGETPEELTITLNAPMLSAEDKKSLKAILLQTKAKWNNKTFK